MNIFRLHIYIILGIFVIGFIIGSFLDLQIMESVFSRDNIFGFIVAAFSVIFGYLVLAFFGVGLFEFALHRKLPITLKIKY